LWYISFVNKSKSIILIDGSNFYFKLKKLEVPNLLEFDFTSFSKFLTKKSNLVQSSYYIGAVRTDGSKKTSELLANQQKLLANLKKHHVSYSLGYLLKSGGRFHGKGVAVNIAVDILVATYENLCDHIIIVSSDTDLLPAIKKAKEKGKIVQYIGFSHQPSLAMIANCSESRLLTKEDILPFVKSKTK